jgi:hypothetical protein
MELAAMAVKPNQVILVKGRNNQHMGRIALALIDQELRCSLEQCNLKSECADCPRWASGNRPVSVSLPAK